MGLDISQAQSNHKHLIRVTDTLRRATTLTFLVYLIDVGLSFFLSIIYKVSNLNIIFGFMGVLLLLGYIAADRRDLRVVGAYIIITAFLLAISLIAGFFTLINSIVIWNTYRLAKSGTLLTSQQTPKYLKTQFAIAVIVLCLHPILLLANIYLLSLASRARAYPLLDKANRKTYELQQTVWDNVEMIAQMMRVDKEQTDAVPSKPSKKAHKKEKKYAKNDPATPLLHGLKVVHDEDDFDALDGDDGHGADLGGASERADSATTAAAAAAAAPQTPGGSKKKVSAKDPSTPLLARMQPREDDAEPSLSLTAQVRRRASLALSGDKMPKRKNSELSLSGGAGR